MILRKTRKNFGKNYSGRKRENISLFHFNEEIKKWNEVLTNYSEEDEKDYYYNSTVNSFSYFYIGESLVGKPVGVIKFFTKVWNFVKNNSFGFIVGLIVLVLIVVIERLVFYMKRRISY
jgi:hypothetical protein